MNGYKESLIHETEANGRCAKPELATAKAAFDQFCRGMMEFGCLPASRGKVKAVPPSADDPFEKYRTRKSKGLSRFLA